MSARTETADESSIPTTERTEFLDSLSGRNEFLDSLSGRNKLIDSLSGYRIDGGKANVETIFVPTAEEERLNARAGGENAEFFFEDEEADDVFERSLSGSRIADLENDTEQVEASGSFAAPDAEVRRAETIAAVESSEQLNGSAESAEIERAPEQGLTEITTFAPRRRFSVYRSFAILIFGLLAFAAGAMATMRFFEFPPELPSLADLTVTAAPEATNLPPSGMVLVPGGEFLMGSDDGDAFSKPAHPTSVAPFFIDQTEVTNEAYFEFVKSTRHDPPTGWVDGRFPEGEARFPVRGVTWYDAADYAAWSGKRLPTETEWEFAARGTDNRTYPWGNVWDDSMANASKTAAGVREVGSGGKSPFGLFDMAGNVWEWTSSDARRFSGGKEIPWSRLRQKIIRGGNWQSDSRTAAAYFRGFYGAAGEKDYQGTGFRCVKDLPKK